MLAHSMPESVRACVWGGGVNFTWVNGAVYGRRFALCDNTAFILREALLAGGHRYSQILDWLHCWGNQSDCGKL